MTVQPFYPDHADFVRQSGASAAPIFSTNGLAISVTPVVFGSYDVSAFEVVTFYFLPFNNAANVATLNYGFYADGTGSSNGLVDYGQITTRTNVPVAVSIPVRGATLAFSLDASPGGANTQYILNVVGRHGTVTPSLISQPLIIFPVQAMAAGATVQILALNVAAGLASWWAGNTGAGWEGRLVLLNSAGTFDRIMGMNAPAAGDMRQCMVQIPPGLIRFELTAGAAGVGQGALTLAP